MRDSYILDACALIAVLTAEPGAEKVRALLRQAYLDQVLVSMNKVNLLEVYYDDYRAHGQAAARVMLEKIKRTPLNIISELSDDIFMEAGRIKAAYRLSLADCIAAATARAYGAALVTADHHELGAVDRDESIRFFWIR
jgi:predicted nucleic acid-binding protein